MRFLWLLVEGEICPYDLLASDTLHRNEYSLKPVNEVIGTLIIFR